MKKYSIYILIICWVFGLTGDELANKMNDRETPLDSKADLIMNLINKKGKSRSYTLHTISKDDGKKQLIWFLAPADDKGIAFLKIEHDDKDDEMRMWLPAFKKIRRISPKNRSDSFMGSDMSYEDLSSRQLKEYNFTNIGQVISDSIPCHLLESIPKNHIRSDYSKHITWVDSTLFIPLKEESFDNTGHLLKKKYFTYKMIQDYHILKQIKVLNIQKNHSTILKFENIKIDTGVKDALFQERYLKRLPK